MTSLYPSTYGQGIFRLNAQTFSPTKKECCAYRSNAKKCIDFCHISLPVNIYDYNFWKIREFVRSFKK